MVYTPILYIVKVSTLYQAIQAKVIWTLATFFIFSCSLTVSENTAKKIVISPNFLVWKFCGKARFRIVLGDLPEAVPFHKISTPGNLVEYGIFRSGIFKVFDVP